MIQTTEIAVDLSCRQLPPHIYAKQGDSESRSIRAVFYSGGKLFSLDDCGRSEIRVKKPDGTITVNEGEISQTAIVFPLSAQSLNVSGEATAEFLLYGKSGELLSAAASKMTIAAAAVGSEAVESLDEYLAFTKEFNSLEADYETFKTEYAAKISEVDSSVQQLQTQDSSLSESIDALKTQYEVQMRDMASAIGTLKENQGGVSLRVLTKSDYDALESHDSATVYYVIDGNKISQYLGDTKLSAGTAATVGSAVQIYSGASESKIVTKS